MKAHLWSIIVAAIVLGPIGTGCKDDSTGGDDGSPSNVVFPDSNVSYHQHVEQLFFQTCALSGCHDAGPHTSELRLTSYGEAVLLVAGVVVPGDPENSRLVLRIEGRVSQRMPLNRNPLNSNQIIGIRRWILEGAENN